MGLSFLFLHESLTVIQWLGVAAFLISLLLRSSRYSEHAPPGFTPLPNMAGIAFQQIAFSHAFGNSDMSQDELDAIRRMMGVEGPLPSEPPLNYPAPPTDPAIPTETTD